MTPVLYLVVPCFNEQETLPSTIEILSDKVRKMADLGEISRLSKILFVNDGSKDNTWKIIKDAYSGSIDGLVSGLNLASNVGHQNAVLSGLMEASKYADIVISIDADLQQDINAMDEMIEHYNNGSDIVFGVRYDRESDGVFKKMTASLFYDLMNLMGCNVIKNHADYRLMSKKAVECLAEYGESCLFLRGIISNLGLSSSVVHFEVKERKFGESKYTLKKMLKLASDGITSFSTGPLHFVFLMGFFIILISMIMIVFSIVAYFKGNVVPGWSTIVCSLFFLGGINLLAVGIVGEYCGKIYMETKKRPRYHIDTVLIKETTGEENNL